MRRIKLFTVYDYCLDSYGDDYAQRLGNGVSDWEEVSDEDFNFIRHNINMISKNWPDTIILVEEGAVSVPMVIKNIKETIAKAKREQEKREETARKAREDAKIKRDAKKLEANKKALAKLIEENPELVKELTSASDT